MTASTTASKRHPSSLRHTTSMNKHQHSYAGRRRVRVRVEWTACRNARNGPDWLLASHLHLHNAQFRCLDNGYSVATNKVNAVPMPSAHPPESQATLTPPHCCKTSSNLWDITWALLEGGPGRWPGSHRGGMSTFGTEQQ